MFKKPTNYYSILGVSQTASIEEIKAQYRKMIKENHPDKISGLKNKYESESDQDLRRILEEAISKAEEKTKQINKAYGVLSDSLERQQYDRSLRRILLSTNKIIFSSIKQGKKGCKSFVVENEGEVVQEIGIDWVKKPGWGEISIEPDPDTTFPIKVTINVSAVGLAPMKYSGLIIVVCDGEQYEILVEMSVTAIERHTASASSPALTPTYKLPTIVVISIAILLLSVIAIVVVSFVATQVRESILHSRVDQSNAQSSYQVVTPEVTKLLNTSTLKSSYQVVTPEVTKLLNTSTLTSTHAPTNTPTRRVFPSKTPVAVTPTDIPLTAAILKQRYVEQNSKATRLELEAEITQFIENPESIVSVERLDGDKFCNEQFCEPISINESDYVYGEYVISNLSKFSEIRTSVRRCTYSSTDYYESEQVGTVEGYVRINLFPGGKRHIFCLEYSRRTGSWGKGYWYSSDAHIYSTLMNQTGDYGVYSFSHSIYDFTNDFSGQIKLSITEVPTNSIEYRILEVVFQYDSGPDYEVSIVESSYLTLYVKSAEDPRIFEGGSRIIVPGEETRRYIFLTREVDRICFSLRAPRKKEVLCQNVP